MDASRYEIIDTIAAGEFATVYRARDDELGREVAVKQIHPQFLADPRQLARYWQEAQLLASLQHPNILTIHDVVRSRGWLILELMQGNLKATAEDGPIDLDYLRVVLTSCLSGLHFLHANGVIHGDVKPSNILVAAPNRVKLGDFGLARRASNEQGSLLKGTTKYMAPEMLSPQFGAVGPASDLYSLGFSAYELLCGAQFESLLPTLTTFGRNKQVAWMMWHSTVDVNLPEISRVLEGVPDDLARVIQKLIAKDQSQRYQSAEEVLRDLRQPVEAVPEMPDPEAEAAAAAARCKRRLRYASILAAAVSLMICLVIVLTPKKQKPPPAAPAGPDQGVVMNVWPEEMKFALTLGDGSGAKEVSLTRYDKIFINDEAHLLRELQPSDSVVIERVMDEPTQRVVKEIRAFRPKMHKGRIQSFVPNEPTFVLRIEDGDDEGKELSINVPADLKLLLNGRPDFEGTPLRLEDLRPGDRVTVRHVGEETGRRATELAAQRDLDMEGVLADDFDARSGLLSIVTAAAGKQQVVKLPFAQQYVITINGQPAAKPTSLKKDDRVAIKHDTQIKRVEAQRTLDAGGVIQQVRYEAPQSMSVLGDAGQKAIYFVGPQCQITLGGEPVTLDDLRAGDLVRIAHGTLDPRNQGAIQAASVAATRPADPTRWALLIAVQNYDDRSLSPLAYPLADARLLADSLVKRYQVPPEQALLMTDQSFVQLEQSIPDRLKRLGPDASLIVYYAGHAYKDEQGRVFLAPKDFKLKQPEANGLALEWLVDRLEECPAKEKLLLLDASHSGAGADLAAEPGVAEMLRTLKLQPSRALFRTVAALASCQSGQHGLDWPARNHGLFAWCLAEGYSGRADANRDKRLEPAELLSYLQATMAQAGSQLRGVQTPELFLPDDRPPRLTETAVKSIRRLAGFLTQTKVDQGEAGREYSVAAEAAGKEIEPRLLYGLVLLKIKNREAATKHFEELKTELPDRLLPSAALAWIAFDKRSYAAGLHELSDLVGRIPKAQPAGTPYSPEAKYLFAWAGQLREFAAAVATESGRPLTESLADLDAAVAAHGEGAAEFYQQGRQRSESIAADFDQRIAATDDKATATGLKMRRGLLANYVDFPIDKYAQQVLKGLGE